MPGMKTIIRFSIDNNGTKTILAVSRELLQEHDGKRMETPLSAAPYARSVNLRVSAIDTRHLQSLNRENQDSRRPCGVTHSLPDLAEPSLIPLPWSHHT